MTDAGKWALDNRKLVYFLIVVMLIGGAYAFYDMSKLEDPELKVKQALVVTAYPGASAHQVELEVTDLLEKSIRTMKGVYAVQSRSMNDVSMIVVELTTLVPNKEVEQYWDMLRRKVNDVQGKLPEGAGVSVVMDDFGDVYGMFYALTSDGFSDKEMSDYAQLIQREMMAIEGIARVNIYGERKKCIEIKLYEDRMAHLGVHPAEVLSTLSGQNRTMYSGYYESGLQRIRVTVNGKYGTVEDIGSLLLQGHENDQLRLRDIGEVQMQIEEPVRNELRYDRLPALGISVAALGGTDVTKLGRQVEKLAAQLQQNRLPVGMKLHKVFFQPDRVNDALGTFMLNLLESVAIVIFVLMLTMGFRSGVIIGFSLVISVIGSFLILNAFNGTLQRVSLGAFILAMGMLVDNAIVIIDGILVDLKRGKPRSEALTAIGRKTAIPLLAATFIAILAFLPIFLSPDTAGIYVRDLFIVLSVSLLLSWLLAITQVPIHAGLLLKNASQAEGKALFESFPYRMLRKTLTWGLRHKSVSIAIAVILIVLSGFAYRMLPQGFFPDMNYDQLYIEYKLPEGVQSARVKQDLCRIEDYLMARPDVAHVVSSIGGTPSRYNLVRSMADPSLSYGELIVDFVSSEKLEAGMSEIQAYLTNACPDAYVRLKRYNLMYKKYPVEAQFSGPDPAVLRKLTAQAQEIMRNCSDIFLINSDWEPPTPTFMVEYNQPAARNIGLSRQDVGLSLLAATGGIPVSVFYDGNTPMNIYFKCVDRNGHAIENLDHIPVFGLTPLLNGINRQTVQELMTGAISEEEVLESVLRTVPLSQASKGVRIVWEDPVVVRYNGQRSMRAQCNPVFGVSAEDARQKILKEIEQIPLPKGYSFRWEGEHRASSMATHYLFKNLPLGVILIITILLLLFKDYKKPIIIFCCIPLIMVGVTVAMLISGKAFGFVAIVGVLGLTGMMVKNGIVLMDEINLQILQGVEPLKALLDSSSSRFRPVMMASLTTILGMLPLITDDLYGSGAVTIMGGLLFGTLIILLFIPILYAVFFKIKVKQ